MCAHAHAPYPLTPPFPLTHAPAPPSFTPPPQTTPLIAGLTVGSAAYAAKLAIEAFAKYKAAPRLRAYYKVSEQEGWGGRVLAARALSLSDSIPPSIPLFPLSLSLQGGFLPEMTRREAALILGLRESAPQERVREAHRRIMIANHPDAGARWWWWREREKKKKKREEGGFFFS